jgi:hypothetical protein
MIRRPLAFVGVLPAAFPVFILAVTLGTFFDGSMGYAQTVTIGMFTVLLGAPGVVLVRLSKELREALHIRNSTWGLVAGPWLRHRQTW